ncbi:major facilitator superfamily domain-containing protein [Calycina marina]|uniref:Major facilitator superfamily domain-containing protein n=1 Tax=Calycina marina TaxID=1763456 RepID=A0A9P7Z6B7_9HELO|nr:major facilitator superfamily domain-containing protein [Calycina marina]
MFGFADEKPNGVSPSISLDNEAGVDDTKAHPELNSDNRHLSANDVVSSPHITERKLVSKIDLRVIPFLCILYLMAFLDRVNIGNARSFGLTTDLNLGGVEYNTALTIFFVPYIVFEVPSNILLKKLSPRVWLMCQGFVNSYGGLLTTRFLLGVFESGMFPGCFYLIGMWYKRSEAQRRYSFFFSSTTLAGAFGGLLAAAIGKMGGSGTSPPIRGYHGWRWIFILEGLLTSLIGIAFFFCIPSFPEDATWLTPDERIFVKKRLQVDQGNSAKERKITLRDVGRVFTDYKIFLGGFMYFGMIVPAYGYAFFAPTILATYGYSAVQTQLHSVPPWACAFGFAMLIAFTSDKLKHRFLFTLIPISIAVCGFAILLAVHDNQKVQYAALFLVALGEYSAMPVIVCWFNMNLGGHHRRAVGSAWQVGFGNIGGIIATYTFLDKDKPRFTTGYAICLGFLLLSALSCCTYAAAVVWENRRRDMVAGMSGLTEEQKTELGDLSPHYRYLL